jgi:hypothetical protein
MTDRSANTVIGLALEVTPGTFVAPSSSTDLLTVADLRPNIAGQTSDVNEFTGSIHKPGAKVGGATFEISGRCLLRGPGGSAPPAADAFVAGRILRAAGFAETILSASVPSGGAEALGGSGNTTAIAALGTGAAATDDLYTGLAIELASLGTIGQAAALAMIKDYVGSGKLASIAHTHSAAYTGNYLIPKQLSYLLSSADPPTLSASCWLGSKRYDGVGLSLSSFRMNFPTFNRDNTEYPSLEFTLTGDFYADADQACPTIDTSLAVSPFKNGKLDISNVPLGGSSVNIDFGAQVAYPPNPNKATGSETSVLVETTRRAEFNLNHVSKATFDFMAKANAQDYHSIQALYGLASGNYIGMVVPKARFNYPSPDNGGPLINMTGEMLIDDADRSVGLTFIYY